MMKFAVLCAYTFSVSLVASWLMTVDTFVTPDKLPDVPRQQRPQVDPTPEPEPTPIDRRCNCGCGKIGCKCGGNVSACSPALVVDDAALDAAMTPKPPERELWLYSPTWCQFCGPVADRLGAGDSWTRLIVKKTDAHFTPNGGYPCFFDPVQLKQWSGSPKDMGELRRAFKITPEVSAVGAPTVATVTEDQVKFLRLLLAESGPVNVPNAEYIHEVNALTIKIPAKVSGTNTVSGGVSTLKLTTPVTVSYGRLVSQSCDGITLAADSLMLSLPGMIDVRVDIRPNK